MLPNGVFEMPFCMKTLSNIWIITISYLSTKLMLLFCPGGWALGLFAYDFLPWGLWFCSLLCPGGGDFALSKIPWGSAWGMLTAGILLINYSAIKESMPEWSQSGE